MRELILLLALGALSSSAQLLETKIWFTGTSCVSCTQSVPERLRRIRGIESARVDAAGTVVEIQLAGSNRVRWRQIRDFIQQDGSKLNKATIRVKGQMLQTRGGWMLEPPGNSAKYEVRGNDLKAGTVVIEGEIVDFHPASGVFPVQISRAEPAERP